MAPTPEWLFGLLMTHVVPVVLLFMVVGAVLGLIAKSVRTATRRTVDGRRRHR